MECPPEYISYSQCPGCSLSGRGWCVYLVPSDDELVLLGVVCHSAAIVQATNGVKEVLHGERGEVVRATTKSVATHFVRVVMQWLLLTCVY